MDILIDYGDKMIFRIKIIIIPCILTCASCNPNFRASGYGLECTTCFKIGWSVVMVLGEPVGYPLEGSIKFFLVHVSHNVLRNIDILITLKKAEN